MHSFLIFSYYDLFDAIFVHSIYVYSYHGSSFMVNKQHNKMMLLESNNDEDEETSIKSHSLYIDMTRQSKLIEYSHTSCDKLKEKDIQNRIHLRYVFIQ